LALFAGCALPGGWLVFRGDRSVGLGLLIGWAAGVIALVVGTVLISVSVPADAAAVGIDPARSLLPASAPTHVDVQPAYVLDPPASRTAPDTA